MLITDAYRDLNAKMHATSQGFGIEGHKYAQNVLDFARRVGTTEILDYGAGRETLKLALSKTPLVVAGYDPAVERLSERPKPADLVTCTDVLEHIEPECLPEVLADIRGLMKRAAYFIITTKLAGKPLPDGTNPHRIVQPSHWWHGRLVEAGFRVINVREIVLNKRYEFLCA